MPLDKLALSQFLPLTRSLELNGIRTEGVTALAAVLKETKMASLKCAASPSVCFCVCQHPLNLPVLSYCPHPSLCSLGYNRIGADGASALAAILKETQITQLKCAAARVFAFVSMPADNSPFALGSVDGHVLQIDELKGTKPTEKIDLSDKRLGVASAIIIASCIKANGVLKELKCAATRVIAFLSMPADTFANTFPSVPLHVPTRVRKGTRPFLCPFPNIFLQYLFRTHSLLGLQNFLRSLTS
jgi:hypothetical protein